MCSSTVVAEAMQLQRINQSEPGLPTVSTSDRRFRFADGRVDEAQTLLNSQSHLASWPEKPFRCI